MLLVAGDTAVVDRDQLAEHRLSAKSCSPADAGFEQVRSPQTFTEDVVTAIRRAHARVDVRSSSTCPLTSNGRRSSTSGCRPALIERAGCPARPRRIGRRYRRHRLGPPSSDRSPDAGPARPQGRAALLRLAERIGAPVATSLAGQGPVPRPRSLTSASAERSRSPVALDTINRQPTALSRSAPGLNTVDNSRRLAPGQEAGGPRRY